MPKQLKPGMPGYETFRLTGHRYGDLQVIRRDDERSARGVEHFQVKCIQCTRVDIFPLWMLERDKAQCVGCRQLLNFRKTGKEA